MFLNDMRFLNEIEIYIVLKNVQIYTKKEQINNITNTNKIKKCKRCLEEFEGTTFSNLCKNCKKCFCIFCQKELDLNNSKTSLNKNKKFTSGYCDEICRTKNMKKSREKYIETRIKLGMGTSPFCNKETRTKAKLTNKKRYGAENVFASEHGKNKIKETNLRLRGVPCSFQDPIVKEKGRKTKLEKYGDENYSNKEKAKQTNLKKYGVEHTFQSEEFILNGGWKTAKKFLTKNLSIY